VVDRPRGESHGSDTRTEAPPRLGNRQSEANGAAIAVIPFLLPPPKNPCPRKGQKASQADVAGSTPVARSS